MKLYVQEKKGKGAHIAYQYTMDQMILLIITGSKLQLRKDTSMSKNQSQFFKWP